MAGCDLCLSTDPNECVQPSSSYYLDFENSVRPYPFRCGQGKFFDYLSKICKPCHPSCLECGDETDSNCPACALGHLRYANTCIPMPNSCLIFNGFWIDLASNRACKPCPANCRACNEVGTVCMDCRPGFWLNSALTCVACSGLGTLYCHPLVDKPVSCKPLFESNGIDCIPVCRPN